MFNKNKKKKEKPSREEMTQSLMELAVAEEELKQLKKEYGIEDEKKEGKLSHKVSSFFEREENRPKVAVSKKKYIWLALLTGWMGGHRFYSKNYRVAFLYLALFWIGFGLYNTIIDIMQVIPMQADEKGNILL